MNRTSGLARVGRGESATPKTVRIAVRLLYTGAVLVVINLVLGLVTLSSFRSAVHTAEPHWSAAKVNTYVNTSTTLNIIESLITLGLWLLLARACSAGKPWGRIVTSIVGGLVTLWLAAGLAHTGLAISLIFLGLQWLVGALAVFLLWRPESSSYFSYAGDAAPAAPAAKGGKAKPAATSPNRPGLGGRAKRS